MLDKSSALCKNKTPQYAHKNILERSHIFKKSDYADIDVIENI